MAIEAEALRAPAVHPFEDVQFWETKRQITHVEARESATRLINSHFRNEDRARVSIPANPDRDDDLIIQSYIRQQARAARDSSIIHRSALAEDTARAVEGWEPIEGAPRNELILIGRYSDGKWDAQTFIIEDANWREDFDWIDDEPTHWMRLPAPPALPRIKGGSHGE